MENYYSNNYFKKRGFIMKNIKKVLIYLIIFFIYIVLFLNFKNTVFRIILVISLSILINIVTKIKIN